MERAGYPKSVIAFTAGLAVFAIAVAVKTTTWPSPGVSLAAALPLSIALAMSGVMQLTFAFHDEVEALDLFEAVLTPLVFLMPGAGVIALAATAKLASQTRLRVPPLKAAFNVAQWSAVAAVASLVYRSGGDGTFRGADIAWLALAMAAALLVNHLSVLVVIALAERRSPASVGRQLRPVVLPGWVVGGTVNVTFGLLFTALTAATPAGTVLVLVPLGSLAWASRCYAASRADGVRLEGLQRATHTLAALVDPLVECTPFLDVVRDYFEAADVELVVLDDRTVIRSGPSDELDDASLALADVVAALGSTVRINASTDDTLAHLLRAKGRRTCLMAPLRQGAKVIGTLATYDRAGFEAFEQREVAVLEALAAEAASALHRSRLVRAIVTERARYSGIVSRSSDGIFSIGPDGRVESWNPAMATITGRTSLDMVGHRTDVLRPTMADGSAFAFDQWTTGAELPNILRITTADGIERWLGCSYSQGLPRDCLVVTARDITRAREVEQLKDDFVGVVSHELRTPLTSIRGFTEMLLDSDMPLTAQQQIDALATIRRGVQRLDRLIVNLLEVSRVTADYADDRSAPVGLHAVCERMIEEHRASNPHRIIVLSGDASAAARANETSVEQIVDNLVVNALKYAPAGPIEVILAADDSTSVIAVRDHGPGIPHHEHERIFERFERLDQATSRAGTGLGLYIARQLAASMGGTLTVESEEGEGATFRLRLPSAPAMGVPATFVPARGLSLVR